MLQKLKKLGAILIIVILLPYMITFFLNRESMQAEEESMLDEYCIRVLAGEVSSEYIPEMLKVQAVLVRTTVYSELKELTEEKMQEQMAQWQTPDAEWLETLRQAWDVTEGQVVMYEEELALVPFHYLSNGKTRSGKEVLESEDYPYLQMIECPKDIGADNQMQTKILNLAGASIVKKDSAGYALEVKVGEETCTGENFRETYDLESSCFELQEFEEKSRVITRGVGHGLGLSQYTANEMAKEGKSYDEILMHFFPKTEIQEVADILWDAE